VKGSEVIYKNIYFTHKMSLNSTLIFRPYVALSPIISENDIKIIAIFFAIAFTVFIIILDKYDIRSELRREMDRKVKRKEGKTA
jgi:hypothetical protein